MCQKMNLLPIKNSDFSVEFCLKNRQSTRRWNNDPVTLQHISQLLWSAQGQNRGDLKKKTNPSAGALYPIELRLIIGSSEIDTGLYKVTVETIEPLSKEDIRSRIAENAAKQIWLEKASIIIGITGVFAREKKKYKQRGIQYTWIEAGCVAQSIQLQCVSIGLGSVIVGGFRDKAIAELLQLKQAEPLLLVGIGYV